MTTNENTKNRGFRIGMAALLAVLLAIGGIFVARRTVLAPTTITAFFPTVTATYPGDEVREGRHHHGDRAAG